MRAASAFLASLLVATALLAPVAAEDDPEEARGPPEGRGMGNMTWDREARLMDRQAMMDHEARWERMGDAQRERALARAEHAQIFARFAYEDGSAEGRFVAFSFDPEAGETTDFEARNTTWFDAVTPSAWDGDEPRVHGATLRADGGNASFAAHNNPLGLFTYRSWNDSLSVVFTLAEDVEATEDSNRTVALGSGDAEAHLAAVGNATLAVDGDEVTATLGPWSAVVFMADPGNRSFGAAPQAMRDAMANGRIGAVANVVADGDTAADDTTALGVDVRPLRVRERLLELDCTSPDPRGRAVLLNLHRDLLGNVSDPRKVRVTLDGVPLAAKDSAEAVLDAAPGDPAAYFASASGDVVQVVVGIDHFSSRALAIASTDGGAVDDGSGGGDGATDDGGTPPPPSTSSDTPASGVVAALAAVAVALALRRRR